MNKKRFNDETELVEKSPLEPPESALVLHDDIMLMIGELIDSPVSSPLEEPFRTRFDELLALFDVYQSETLAANDKTMSCHAGCSVCCNHWAEDVASFETAIIGDYIRKNMPERIEEIVSVCRADVELIEKLKKIVDIKLKELADAAIGDPEDYNHTFTLLSAFYQMDHPCPLLDKNGACSIYPVRPITCRIYMSFSDPARCLPHRINEGEVVTYILDFLEEANELLDELHLKFKRGDTPTALRAAIVEELGS